MVSRLIWKLVKNNRPWIFTRGCTTNYLAELRNIIPEDIRYDPNKTALTLLTHGSEEMSCAILTDIMGRAGVRMSIAGLGGYEPLRCSNRIVIKPTTTLEEAVSSGLPYDVIFVPGGYRGIIGLCQNSLVGELLKMQDNNKRFIACCNFACIVLAHFSIGEGKKITASLQAEHYFGKHFIFVKNAPLQVDGHFISIRSPINMVRLGLVLVELMSSLETAQTVAGRLSYNYSTISKRTSRDMGSIVPKKIPSRDDPEGWKKEFDRNLRKGIENIEFFSLFVRQSTSKESPLDAGSSPSESGKIENEPQRKDISIEKKESNREFPKLEDKKKLRSIKYPEKVEHLINDDEDTDASKTNLTVVKDDLTKLKSKESPKQSKEPKVKKHSDEIARKQKRKTDKADKPESKSQDESKTKKNGDNHNQKPMAKQTDTEETKHEDDEDRSVSSTKKSTAKKSKSVKKGFVQRLQDCFQRKGTKKEPPKDECKGIEEDDITDPCIGKCYDKKEASTKMTKDKINPKILEICRKSCVEKKERQDLVKDDKNIPPKADDKVCKKKDKSERVSPCKKQEDVCKKLSDKEASKKEVIPTDKMQKSPQKKDDKDANKKESKRDENKMKKPKHSEDSNLDSDSKTYKKDLVKYDKKMPPKADDKVAKSERVGPSSKQESVGKKLSDKDASKKDIKAADKVQKLPQKRDDKDTNKKESKTDENKMKKPKHSDDSNLDTDSKMYKKDLVKYDKNIPPNADDKVAKREDKSEKVSSSKKQDMGKKFSDKDVSKKEVKAADKMQKPSQKRDDKDANKKKSETEENKKKTSKRSEDSYLDSDSKIDLIAKELKISETSPKSQKEKLSKDDSDENTNKTVEPTINKTIKRVEITDKFKTPEDALPTKKDQKKTADEKEEKIDEQVEEETSKKEIVDEHIEQLKQPAGSGKPIIDNSVLPKTPEPSDFVKQIEEDIEAINNDVTDDALIMEQYTKFHHADDKDALKTLDEKEKPIVEQKSEKQNEEKTEKETAENQPILATDPEPRTEDEIKMPVSYSKKKKYVQDFDRVAERSEKTINEEQELIDSRHKEKGTDKYEELVKEGNENEISEEVLQKEKEKFKQLNQKFRKSQFEKSKKDKKTEDEKESKTVKQQEKSDTIKQSEEVADSVRLPINSKSQLSETQKAADNIKKLKRIISNLERFTILSKPSLKRSKEKEEHLKKQKEALQAVREIREKLDRHHSNKIRRETVGESVDSDRISKLVSKEDATNPEPKKEQSKGEKHKKMTGEKAERQRDAFKNISKKDTDNKGNDEEK